MVKLTKPERTVAKVFNIYEAKTNLSELVELASRGEEVIIAKAGVPKVRLVPVPQPGMVREPGLWEGRIEYGPGWDAPMSEAELKDWEGATEDEFYE